MKCLRCNLVNPTSTTVCKRCRTPLFSDPEPFSKRNISIYRDTDFLVVKPNAALPKRCYRCNSREIVVNKTQTLEYVPAVDEVLEFAVGALLPIPLFSSPRRKEIQLDLFFCRRHRSFHRTFYKAGWGVMLFGVLCFFGGFFLESRLPNLFGYAMVTAVAAICIGMLLLYIEKEKDIVSKHKFQAPYFWVNGFGEEYLSSFPNWTNSPSR